MSESPAQGQGRAGPDVSFAIASYNSRAYLEDAVASALAQEGVTVEVLIVDDGSSDGSDDLARELAARDPRIRALSTPRNLGPAGARNLALKAMRGRWFAVLDSDDLLLPGRTRELLARAEAKDADLVADDLLVFGKDGPERRFLGASWPSEGQVTLETYLDHSVMYGRKPNLGFLKPMISRRFLGRSRIAYDESLRIGEDDALVLDCLLAGAAYLVCDFAAYRYRKHEQSISHRLSASDAERMTRVNAALRARLQARSTAERKAFERRAASHDDALAFARAVDALKRRKLGEGLAQMLRRPGCIPLFMMPVRSRLERLRSAARPSAS